MNTRYKWDLQKQAFVPRDKMILAMGRRVTRTMVVMGFGAMPRSTFRLAYRNSTAFKRLVWWVQSTRNEVAS